MPTQENLGELIASMELQEINKAFGRDVTICCRYKSVGTIEMQAHQIMAIALMWNAPNARLMTSTLGARS